MGFEYDCAGAIICPIQPPKFGINGQRTKARCIGCPHAAFCTTRNDVIERMDEIRQSVTNETTKEWMAIRYITFLSVTMTTIISVQSPPYLTISRRINSACPLPDCGIMASRNKSHTATKRLSSAVGWFNARKQIAETRTPNEMHMKSTCNANASLFDANAFQMQCKCICDISHQCKCIKKQCKCISFLCKCIAFAWHKGNIYIISLYISFHFIYRERGNKFPSPPKSG